MERIPAALIFWLTFAVVAIGLGLIYWQGWLGEGRVLDDAGAYWQAAQRLTSGQDLYAASDHPYRYAPWFALAVVPLTALPPIVVGTGWLVLLLAATTWIVMDLLTMHRPSACILAGIMGPVLGYAAPIGNSQPLVVAMLYFGLERRGGPAWIAVTASMKFAPILFILVYVARREWWRVAWVLMGVAVLLGPMLVFDLSGFAAPAGGRLSLWQLFSPTVGYTLLGALTAWALWLALHGSQWTALAVGLILSVGHPRAVFSYTGYLLPALRGTRTPACCATGWSRNAHGEVAARVLKADRLDIPRR